MPQPQPAEGVTYAAKIDKAEARVDWSRPAVEVDRLIRGLSPFPGAWTTIGGERVKLLRSRLATGTGALLLLGMTNAGITIGDGLTTIWAVTAVWISIRAVFGVTRVFPGFGAAPLKECTQTN